MTMPRVVLDISLSRKDLALFYVGISRVRRLEDLMFEQPFDLARITAEPTRNSIMRATDWERRRLQRLQPGISS